jgi:hypothetical protein
MTAVIGRRRILLIGSVLLVSVWAVVYFLWPRFSFDDGPFFAEPFAADLAGLPVLSSVDLSLLGATLFVLETRATPAPDPRTVFVLKNPSGSVRWARATSADFGRIHVVDRAPCWFVAGGWVVTIKPERTESGELYLSPFGGFRFFFHSW